LEQVLEVVEHLDLKRENINPFSRCVRCNTPIEEIEKDAVLGRVPDYIWESHELFHTCSTCNRIYWQGSHTERGMEKIASFFRRKK